MTADQMKLRLQELEEIHEEDLTDEEQSELDRLAKELEAHRLTTLH